jgi:hypothetical protein
MHIDWSALGIVTVVSVVATVAFMALLSFGVRCISAATVTANQGGNGTGVRSVGYTLLALAGLLVLFCLYLIVPQFH